VAPRVTRQLICVHNPRRPLSEAARLFIDTLGSELADAANVLHNQEIN
jgi:hypothetical protein